MASLRGCAQYKGIRSMLSVLLWLTNLIKVALHLGLPRLGNGQGLLDILNFHQGVDHADRRDVVCMSMDTTYESGREARWSIFWMTTQTSLRCTSYAAPPSRQHHGD